MSKFRILGRSCPDGIEIRVSDSLGSPISQSDINLIIDALDKSGDWIHVNGIAFIVSNIVVYPSESSPERLVIEEVFGARGKCTMGEVEKKFRLNKIKSLCGYVT